MQLKDYVRPRGTASRLAATLGISHVLISQWTADEGARQVPIDRCPAIELDTRGMVTVEELRPDAKWSRVRDKRWPHPKGRPVLEFEVAPKATA